METPKKLLNKNFFLLWQGQAVSMMGSNVFSIAMVFWVKHATGSAALIGLMLMASSIPAVLFGTIGGAFADRYSRRNIILMSDFVNGSAVVFLAVLIYQFPDMTGMLVAALLLTSILIGITNAFFQPAFSASIPELVPTEKVATANSLGQISLQLSMFVGQGLGGVLFRILGAPLLILFNGLSYLFSGVSESFITIPQEIPQKGKNWRDLLSKFRLEIVEGFRYIWAATGLKKLVLLSSFLSFFMMPIIVLLPFYVENYLKVKADWYGFLLALYGIGSLAGSVIAGIIKLDGKRRGHSMIALMILQSVIYGGLGLVKTPYQAIVLAISSGMMSGFILINVTTLLQLTTPTRIRGRVFGFLATLSGGLSPLGMGLGGVIFDMTGQNIPVIYVSCGVIMAFLTLVVSTSTDFRKYLAHVIEGKTADIDMETVGSK